MNTTDRARKAGMGNKGKIKHTKSSWIVCPVCEEEFRSMTAKVCPDCRQLGRKR